MRLLRFYRKAPLSVSTCAVVLIFMTNINVQFCEGATTELTTIPVTTTATIQALSSPEECARECRDDEPSKTCYYHFVLEYYTTNGGACDICNTSTNYSRITPMCECIISDGYEKTVFSINRMIPGPSIQVCKDDYIIVDVQNNAAGIETVLHWHGIFQNGYQYYDGVSFVTQCPILSSTTFRYRFKAKNSGTHFYHSHILVHMIDGQYGSLIVRDPPSLDPHYNRYDKDCPEHVIVINDLFHELSIERYPGRYRRNRGQIPDNILINGRGNWTDLSTGENTNVPLSTFMVKKGERYRFRLINAIVTACLVQITIESHSMQIIATDGQNVEPTSVDSVIMSPGERVDFILNADQNEQSYWIHVRGLGECEEKGIYQLARLIYEGSPQLSQSPIPKYWPDSIGSSSRIFAPENSTDCDANLCVDQLRKIYNNTDEEPVQLNKTADQEIIMFFQSYKFNLSTLFGTRDNEYKSFFVSQYADHLTSVINNISYEYPRSLSGPLITQKEVSKCKPCNPSLKNSEPCACANIYDIPLGAVVDVMVYDKGPIPHLYHPFHLHGYSFCVLYAGQFNNASNKNLISNQDVDQVWQDHKNRVKSGAYKNCAPKDTVVVPNTGYVILRFKADNPGWWLFHCHFSWDMVTGMLVVFHVGEQSDLPKVPKAFPNCSDWTPPNDDLQ